MKSIMNLFFVLTTFCWAAQSQAGYLTIGESGELVKPQSYRIGAAPQFLTNEGGGMNVQAFLDAGWTEEMTSRFSFGVGKVDFNIGASLKYIPFPDVGDQPAIGVKATGYFARMASESITTLQLAPMISKKYQSDNGLWIPYTAVAFNVGTFKDRSGLSTNFVIGSELQHPEAERFLFAAEVGFNLKDSFSWVAGFVSIPFDSKTGFKKR
ncbi:MAG: hypothetical protein AABY64_02400 [Bdellovibrionota bacterium]